MQGVSRSQPLRRCACALVGISIIALCGLQPSNAASSPQSLGGAALSRGEPRTGGGPRPAAAFQSTFVPVGITLRPASCNTQPVYSIGRQSASGVRTLVSQYRGRSRGGPNRRPPQNKGPLRNDKIPFPEMRVVVANADGKDEMLGVMSKEEALARADDYEMDLIVVSPDANPPVCKIINYDKLRYELEKKEKAKKKNQSVQELKEVKLSYKIDTHDYEVRKRATLKFLTKGDKVKASIRFKGREMAHRQLAETTLSRLLEDVKDFGAAQRRPSMEGRIMQMIIDPLPEVTKAAEMKRKQGKKEKGKKGKKGEEEEEEEDKEVEAMLAAQDAEDDSENDDEDAAGHDIDYDIDELSEAEVQVKINEVGERIRTMKADNVDKSTLSSHVEELLALKARYLEITGKAWAPASASAA